MNNTNKAKAWTEAKDYVMITIAMLSYCIGWAIFLLPNNITTGGVAGVTSILYWATGIPVQFSYFVINAILLLFALRILGWKFCVKTVFAVVVLTVAVGIVTENYQSHLLADQPFMAAIIGSVFCGCGVGLGLSNNGSTGGTDIIAAIVNKYRDISLGRVILICDVIIISSSYFVLKDWEKVIYGEVKMLFVLAKRRQSDVIFRIINEIDPSAFVSQSAVIGVYGEGFDRFKVRRQKSKE